MVKVTSIIVKPVFGNKEAKIRANVSIILNETLIISGFHIKKYQGMHHIVPPLHFSSSKLFTKEFKSKVLQEYAKILTEELSYNLTI